MKLNDNFDGPYAFAKADLVAAWNGAQRIIELIEDNDGEWSDWDSAKDAADIYEVETSERGLAIIDAGIANNGQGIEDAMKAWEDEIYEEANGH